MLFGSVWVFVIVPKADRSRFFWSKLKAVIPIAANYAAIIIIALENLLHHERAEDDPFLFVGGDSGEDTKFVDYRAAKLPWIAVRISPSKGNPITQSNAFLAWIVLSATYLKQFFIGDLAVEKTPAIAIWIRAPYAMLLFDIVADDRFRAYAVKSEC